MAYQKTGTTVRLHLWGGSCLRYTPASRKEVSERPLPWPESVWVSVKCFAGSSTGEAFTLVAIGNLKKPASVASK